MTGRIQQHLERLQQWRAEKLDDTGRKRFATSDVRDDTELAKRQRLENGVQNSLDPSYFKSEMPTPLSQLYTLTNDEGCKNFDVQAIPVDIVVKILVPILGSLDASQIDTAINVRYFSPINRTLLCKTHVQCDIYCCISLSAPFT